MAVSESISKNFNVVVYDSANRQTATTGLPRTLQPYLSADTDVDIHLCVNRATGFTLIELKIAIAIAAVILGMGIPSMTSVVKDQRLSSALSVSMAATASTNSNVFGAYTANHLRFRPDESSSWKAGRVYICDDRGNVHARA